MLLGALMVSRKRLPLAMRRENHGNASNTYRSTSPGTNGSTVNSTRSVTRPDPNDVLLTNGTVVDVDGARVADVRMGNDGRIAAVAAVGADRRAGAGPRRVIPA